MKSVPFVDGLVEEDAARARPVPAVAPSPPAGRPQPSDRRRALLRGLKAAAAYVLAAVLSLAILVWVMRLWRADLRVPFSGGYGGVGFVNASCDGLAVGMMIKGVMDNGWYLHNPFLGGPGGLDMQDYPLADNLHFAVLKIILLAVRDYGVAFNLYFLLTFPLTTVCALAAFRRFGLAWAPALAGSLLFTFLPYHFFRGEAHLFLAAYYLLPLVVMVMLWIYRDGSLFSAGWAGGGLSRAFTSRPAAAVAVGLLVSAGAVYYAFFSCYLLLTAGLASCWWRRKWSPLWSALFVIACIAVGVAANLLPALAYRWQHGPNPVAAARGPAEAEMYGLKLTQLVLPVAGHRLATLARLKEYYDGLSVPVPWETYSSLGTVGCLGFLTLLALLLPRRRGDAGPHLLDGLCVLNLAAVLLAVIGGFGSVFNLLVVAQIRCYDRLCIFISFFSLFAVAWGLHALAARHGKSRLARLGWSGAAILLAVVGLLDQTTNDHLCVPDYAAIKRVYDNDAEFVGRIEAALPAGAAVFQLPYIPFPESGNHHRLIDYEPFRPYLHSRRLHWSYGAMRGRDGDLWLKATASLPAEDLLPALAYAGFGGVYLDRFGYGEGETTEAALKALLGAGPRESGDGRYAFFDLTGYAEALRRNCSDGEWQERREAALHPVLLSWQGGFYAEEGEGRWCAEKGELALINPSSRARTVRLEMTCATAYARPSRLRITGDLFVGERAVSVVPEVVAKTVTVPPGRHSLSFACDAPKMAAPDGRTLVLSVSRVRVTESK